MSIELTPMKSDSMSLLEKNNQQIAHDLRSPISALNILSSLTPDLSEDGRSLLKMAIDRLEEMANKLDTPPQGPTY